MSVHAPSLASLAPVTLAPREENRVETVFPAHREGGFCYKKYLLIGLVASVGAAILFSISTWGFALAAGVAFWYLASSAVIVLNSLLADTFAADVVHTVYAMMMEVNSVIASAALFPFTLFKKYHGPHPNLEGRPIAGRPILLIHGYLSYASTWDFIRSKLARERFGPVYTINLGSMGCIREYAEKVKQKIAQIHEQTGRHDIDIIGHSRGGLVAAYYATKKKDPETQIAHLITIGSPLAGTHVADLGFGADVRQMRLDSTFHARIRRRLHANRAGRDTCICHIAAQRDIVVPYGSALMRQHRHQLVLPDMGHLGMLFSTRVADQIVHWLRPHPPVQPVGNP